MYVRKSNLSFVLEFVSDALGAQLKGKTQFQAIIPEVLEGPRAIILLLTSTRALQSEIIYRRVRQIKGCAPKDRGAIICVLALHPKRREI